MKNAKTDKADRVFSDFIRLRDGECVRCHRQPCERADGLKVKGLTNSHFFGRRKESTRFDPENCDALCAACHQYWSETDREGYRTFKVNQLGKRFDLLVLRANTPGKKNREASYLVAKKMLEDLKNDRC